MTTLPRLNKKVMSISSLDDFAEEKAFWLSKSKRERVEAIELNGGWFMAKIELHPDFRDFLRLLNSHGVEDLENLKINKKASGRNKDLEHLP